jgi:hypothetical protein
MVVLSLNIAQKNRSKLRMRNFIRLDFVISTVFWFFRLICRFVNVLRIFVGSFQVKKG